MLISDIDALKKNVQTIYLCNK